MNLAQLLRLCLDRDMTTMMGFYIITLSNLHMVTNLDSVLKSRDITFLTKVHIVKAMMSPVGMYKRESWIIKKAERQRIDALELWC